MSIHALDRRSFLACLGVSAASGGVLAALARANAAEPAPNDLIKSIRRSIPFPGRRKKGVAAWFHPRACVLPTADGPLAVMTMQRMSGSDYFHPVCWTTSSDLGRTWTEPVPIPGMERHSAEQIRPGLSEGVCDVVPEFHRRTNTVLAMGHNVYYEKGRLARPQGPRWPVYSVRDAAGQWSPLGRLVWDNPRGTEIYTCGCSQRVTLDDGDLVIAISMTPLGRMDRMVTSVRCGFDGRTVAIKQVGNTLELAKGRGLLEPSLTTFGGRFWMTIRAEDDHGYLATSDDGLHWSPIKAWAWDDGSPVVTSTTQQHWLTHSDGLFLVYTLRADNNARVVRWRAPLFLAQVDTDRGCLLRETERVVFPLIGDGIKKPGGVALMGNFHTTNVTPGESWVTVGENFRANHWQGDMLLARVGWNKPNRLVEGLGG
ncbi:MAG TPA: sialidase family protein [Thermoguttaceae bacterium]|nr:sialidase family protein [Thermoguttaceae bacterium]